jgi:cellulose synthase/poly-beta-1,6-N-acetylglucosamine synthase-like glycosyltransferase
VTVIAAATAALLVAFSLRRVLLLAASLARSKDCPEMRASDLPSVTIIIPAHNEAGYIGGLLAALGALDYPRDRLTFMLACDGCTDATEEHLRAWARHRPNAVVLGLSKRVGKAAALNAALALAKGEIVVTLDADLVPRPDLVRHLVATFTDASVGGAAAFITPRNGDASVVARYSALNALVHQLVTSAGKDRLGLNPPTLGASAYRRSALGAIGGFADEAVGEDVATSVALTRAGWRTRFVAGAVAETAVAETPREYWAQHVRWTRATLRARARRARRPASLPAALRAEEWLLRFGNGDRVVFLVSVFVALAGLLPFWVPLAYFAVPAVQAAVVLARAGSARRLPAVAAAGVLMIPLDVAASVAGVLGVTRVRSDEWDKSRRPVAETPSR